MFLTDDELNIVECETTGEKTLLERRIPYPEFKVVNPVMIVFSGKVNTGIKRESYWRDRVVVNIGEELKGFVEDELELNPAIEIQEMENFDVEKVETVFKEYKEYQLKKDQLKIFDFGINLTGFIGAEIEVTRAGRLFLKFDEILSDGDVRFTADHFGDWREEIITVLPGEIRIYTTTIPTKDRRVTLLQDPVYRSTVTHNSMGY